jgi:hypothetical protein
MTSGGVEDGQKSPAPAAVGDAPNNDAKPKDPNPYAVDTDSDLSESLPRRRKSSSQDREDATKAALWIQGEQSLPYDDDAPPLPDEAPPDDDGWDYEWDHNAQHYYYYNRLTGKSQWENPRLPQAPAADYGSYDRFANNLLPPCLPSYPNPCLLQICEQLNCCPRDQLWCTWHLVSAQA